MAKGKAYNEGLYLPLPIPNQPWSDVSMDFVLRLLRNKRGNSIFALVDHFSKMVHFIACKKTTDAISVATLFFNEIYRLHDLPTSIVSDRDTRFLCHLWGSLWKLLGTSLDMSSAYHPLVKWRSWIVLLGNVLCCLVGDNIKSWDTKLGQAEFAHNHATNRSMRLAFLYCVWSCSSWSVGSGYYTEQDAAPWWSHWFYYQLSGRSYARTVSLVRGYNKVQTPSRRQVRSHSLKFLWNFFEFWKFVLKIFLKMYFKFSIYLFLKDLDLTLQI